MRDSTLESSLASPGRSCHSPLGTIMVDATDNNSRIVDSLPESELEIAVELIEFNEEVLAEEPGSPVAGRRSRPGYARGFPDYACPKVSVEHIRLSVPNVSSVKPAGNISCSLA